MIGQPLPPPTTFAEGQRLRYGIFAAAAGICFGLAVLVGAGVITFKDWGKDQLHFQLVILFVLLIGGTINTTIVVVGLLLGGPVGKFSGKASDGTRTIELDAEASGTQP